MVSFMRYRYLWKSFLLSYFIGKGIRSFQLLNFNHSCFLHFPHPYSFLHGFCSLQHLPGQGSATIPPPFFSTSSFTHSPAYLSTLHPMTLPANLACSVQVIYDHQYDLCIMYTHVFQPL